MSAVVDFVGDVFEGVGDVFEAVGDVVEDVAGVVGDAIEYVGDTVQAVIDDPLPTLLSVAGSFVGIPPAVTMGAITAARGGDLEDIVLAAGTAHFAPQIGGAISSTVSSTFIEAGLNETFSQIASDSISKGLVNGTIAEVKGGSFEDGFAGGFTGGIVAGGVGEVASYVKPEIIDFAMESGLDLKDANAVFNAGTKAFSAGVTSEITGRGDFSTSFASSVIGSGVDAATRSINANIDEQFASVSTNWNESDKKSEPVDLTITGAGIPNSVVGEVAVSGYGVNNTAEPETTLADAPKGETDADFKGLIGADKPASVDGVLTDAPVNVADVPKDVADIANENIVSPVLSSEPVGGLSALPETVPPAIDLNIKESAVTSEAPFSQNIVPSSVEVEQPTGGLNAVAQTGETTPVTNAASSTGLNPTNFTKPLISTAGNFIKRQLTQSSPARRAPMTRPAGALRTVNSGAAVRPAPPQRVDISQLTPIQKATPIAPPKTLANNSGLSPITNATTLTSLLKKA